MLCRRHLPALAAAVLPAAAAGAQPRPTAAPATVFAAASLQDALRDLGRQWQERRDGGGGTAPRFSFAASSALGRQIEQGAPADLFLSADQAWMDYLQERGLILPETRLNPLGNTLVLVAPAQPAVPPVTLEPGAADLRDLLGPQGRIATGDPAHVPAGRYAEAALRWLGAWEALAPRLARADNVRAALLLVERGEAPLGIVYSTDAQASPGVRVLGTFPAESHPPISCPFALTRRAAANAEARALLGFLAGAEAAPTWRRFGFSLPQ